MSGTGGSIANPNSPTTTFNGVQPQSYVLRYTITNGCGTTTDDKTINLSVPTVSDFEGNLYPIVTIGTQTWTVPNIKSTKYADGSDITFFYPNNNAVNKDNYGLLYNPAAALNNTFTAGTQGVCPNGYHVPTEAELLVLFAYLESHPSEYAKFPPINAGQGHATNPIGFNSFNLLATSTVAGPSGSENQYFYGFSVGSHVFFFMSLTANYGLSVRCLKN